MGLRSERNIRREFDRTYRGVWLPNLTADEMREVHARARAGDAEARDRLVRSCLRLVLSCALRFRTTHVEPADLLAAGVQGLVEAIDRHDPERGTKFVTTAMLWIRKCLLEFVRKLAPLVYIPRYLFPLLDDETKQRYFTRYDTAACFHLTRPEPDDSEVFTDAERSELARRMAELPREWRKILALRFGLDGRRERTLVEVGRGMGVSKERVRQIQQQALARLTGTEDEFKAAKEAKRKRRYEAAKLRRQEAQETAA